MKSFMILLSSVCFVFMSSTANAGIFDVVAAPFEVAGAVVQGAGDVAVGTVGFAGDVVGTVVGCRRCHPRPTCCSPQPRCCRR